VGKMTVGRALSERVGYPLLHNHVSIEVALRFFDFGTDGFNRISQTIRDTVFDTVRDSELPGLIFTYAWAFNLASELRHVERFIDRWQESSSGQIYFLELAASEEAKRARNLHPDRLDAKPSKRDTVRSEALRRAHNDEYQFDSDGRFPLTLPHLYVDNTDMNPVKVADLFLRTFELS
jgi:hypothetical protein